MQRCPSCGEENSDRARFCQACATQLTAETPAADVGKGDLVSSAQLRERLASL